MDKILQLEERFYGTGEPTVVPLARWIGHKHYIEKAANFRGQGMSEKLASPAFDYIKNIVPEEGSTFILVNALGAYETYDDNRNGDGFPEHPYQVGVATKCGHPQCQPKGLRGWIAPDETTVQHYKTFEQFGGIYKHHVNKDPSKSLGDIKFAVWNGAMHRVELVLRLQNSLDAELIDRINSGEFPAVSMGCHVKWDTCTICGHRAPTRRDYCEHARDSMRKVLPSGEKVCVLNPSPRFFDISIVFRPADPTGFMLKKVAQDSGLVISSALIAEKHAQLEEKGAAVRKLSDIQKTLIGPSTYVKPGAEGEILRKYRAGVLNSELEGVQPKSDKEMEVLSEYSIPEVASTLASKNAALSTGEFARLFVRKVAGFEPSANALDRIVAVQPLLREVIACYPDVAEKISQFVDIHPKHVRNDLLSKLSSMGEWLKSELTPHMPVGPGYRYHATQPAKTDLLTMTDPQTGQTYNTTRGAGMEADAAHQKHILAASAMASLAYGAALSKVPYLNKSKLLVGGGALALGYPTGKALVNNLGGYRHPEYMTDQGLPVSGNTEFMKSSSAPVSPGVLFVKMAYDYAERLPNANAATQDLETLLYGKIVHAGIDQNMSMFMHPVDLQQKVAWFTEGLEQVGAEDGDPLSLDIEKFAERLGTLLTS